MLPLLVLAAAADAPVGPAPRVAASQPAQAVVRIVRGAEIRISQAVRFEESVLRETMVREHDGSSRPVSLVEFY